MKENNEKKMKNEDEISKLIKAFPKDIAALDKRSVLAKVNSQGSGTCFSGYYTCQIGRCESW
jgi:hypothetical protein